jgi:predicted TIM-barrel fold metal-dependent hydrolase
MKAYKGPIVDIDIHNLPVAPGDIEQYLPERWREFKAYDPAGKLARGAGYIGYGTPAPHVRRSTGGPPGSSYEVLREDVLDPFGYYKGILTHNLGEYPDLTNQYFMVDVCRAANDWLVDQWLARDERLAGVIIVPIQMIDEAVAEVHRLGDHPQMVGILLTANPLRRPYGDPLLHPIYAAAVEHGLAITTHVGFYHANSTPAGAIPNTIAMGTGVYTSVASHHISSFITHGVFEKFPKARFVLLEYGVEWLPDLIWRLDAEYSRWRIESPWVKRWPREYIHDHVRLSTQPLATGPRHRDLGDYLSVIDGIEDVLCFSSDWPHPTMDDHFYVARHLPDAWHDKVFRVNACETFGFAPPPVEAEPQPAGSPA